MSLPAAVADCSVCPRLCRDVCPVAVHGHRDDFVPSEKMRGVAAALGHGAGVADPQRLLACTDCGACTAYCLLSVPVAPWLDEALDRLQHPRQTAPAAPPATIVPHSDLPMGAVLVPACTPSARPSRDRDEVAAPAATTGACPPGRRCVPSVGDGHHAEAPDGVVIPPLGSTCCGERLDPRVGDPELRARMAKAMLRELADGTTVGICNAACAAHLAQHNGDRLHIVEVTDHAVAIEHREAP